MIASGGRTDGGGPAIVCTFQRVALAFGYEYNWNIRRPFITTPNIAIATITGITHRKTLIDTDFNKKNYDWNESVLHLSFLLIEIVTIKKLNSQQFPMQKINRWRTNNVKVEQQLCQSGFLGEKVKFDIFSSSFLEFVCVQRLWELVNVPHFFLWWYEVCGIFIKLNINERYTYNITIGWNFGLLSRLMQNIGNFFHLWIPFCCQYDRLFEFSNPLFSFQFSPFSFFSLAPTCDVEEGTSCKAFASTNKRIIKYQWINLWKRWFLRSASLPASFAIYSWIHVSDTMCTLCVRFVLVLLFKGLLPVTVTFAHSKFTFPKKKNVRTNSDNVGKNYFQNVENRWHTAVKAASKHEMALAMQWRWQERQKNTRTHSRHNNEFRIIFNTHIWFDLWNIQFLFGCEYLCGFYFNVVAAAVK